MLVIKSHNLSLLYKTHFVLVIKSHDLPLLYKTHVVWVVQQVFLAMVLSTPKNKLFNIHALLQLEGEHGITQQLTLLTISCWVKQHN